MNTCLKSNSLANTGKTHDLITEAHSLFGVKIHNINYSRTVERILEWSSKSESRYICLANVHMIMEAHDSPKFKQILNQADLVTPDGKPLSWLLQSNQVCGRQLTLQLCQLAQNRFISVGFYGGKKQVLNDLVLKIQKRYPFLKIAYAYSTPFRSLNLEEQNDVVEKIKKSGTKILFIGLGCPKQERWMSINKHRLPLVMLGIGGAFDVLSGAKACPPLWIQNIGLEWLFRLCLEPQRLWYRNLYHSSKFLILLASLKSVNLIKALRNLLNL